MAKMGGMSPGRSSIHTYAAIVPALAADAALPVRADDATTSSDDGAGPASTSLECASCKTSCAPAATPRDDDDAEPRTGEPRRRRLAAIAAMPAAHLAQLLAFVVFCFCVKSADRRESINNLTEPTG